jgi:hypothetical protein
MSGSDGKTWSYPVKTDHTGRPVVLDVHDGDTVKLLLDAGCDTGIWPWLRLSGAGAPELTAPGGPEATEWMAEQLLGATEITVVVHGRSFARWLASIAVDGVELSDALVASGHGTYRTGDAKET